jgi:hypothetical protein
MPEIQISVFAQAVDVLCLFAENSTTPVAVVETDHTLGLRPFLHSSSVGLVIPKARPSSRGVSYTRVQMAEDQQAEGIMLGAFRNVFELRRLLKAVRHNRRRGDNTNGEVVFDPAADPMHFYMYEPGSFTPVVGQPRWTGDQTWPRLPVYLTTASVGNRVSPSVMKALGLAGAKISPLLPWFHQDGRWEIQGPQGQTLRVATWPTNP